MGLLCWNAGSLAKPVKIPGCPGAGKASAGSVISEEGGPCLALNQEGVDGLHQRALLRRRPAPGALLIAQRDLPPLRGMRCPAPLRP